MFLIFHKYLNIAEINANKSFPSIFRVFFLTFKLYFKSLKKLGFNFELNIKPNFNTYSSNLISYVKSIVSKSFKFNKEYYLMIYLYLNIIINSLLNIKKTHSMLNQLLHKLILMHSKVY